MGADYTVANGRYRLTRVYNAENATRSIGTQRLAGVYYFLQEHGTKHRQKGGLCSGTSRGAKRNMAT